MYELKYFEELIPVLEAIDKAGIDEFNLSQIDKQIKIMKKYELNIKIREDDLKGNPEDYTPLYSEYEIRKAKTFITIVKRKVNLHQTALRFRRRELLDLEAKRRLLEQERRDEESGK